MPLTLSTASASLCPSALRLGATAARSTSYRSTRNHSRLVCNASIQVGDTAPDFSLVDETGKTFTLSKSRGSVVLFFYPADDTPGCTKQAVCFTARNSDFTKLGASVYGVSSQSAESKRAFKQKYSLSIPLLIDDNSELRKKWGVPSDMLGLLPGRVTYVIDKNRKVRLVYNNQLAPESHVEKALEVLQQL